MIIGIDFSIKSTSIAIRSDIGKLLHFYAFPRKSVVKEEHSQFLQSCQLNVRRLDDEPRLDKSANLTQRERSSMHDAVYLVASIIETLKTLHQITKDTKVGIEGFSFGSTGNRLTQISGYQWLLRSQIVKEFGIPIENIWIFAPMTVKATAGKGNFKKEEMIAAFIEDTHESTRFARHLKESPEKFQNAKGGWLKPLDDVADAYWVLQTLEKLLV